MIKTTTKQITTEVEEDMITTEVVMSKEAEAEEEAEVAVEVTKTDLMKRRDL